MARPGVSFYDVANAASILLEKGENPTIDKVRQKIGSGSNSTIANHLKQWKEENMPTTSLVANTTIPANLLSQIQSLWDHLKEEAKKNVEHTQNELAAQLDISSKQKEEIKSFNARFHALEAKYIDQLRLIDKYKAGHAEQVNKINLLGAHVEAERSRVKDKEITIEDLKIQLSNLHNNFAHFQKASIDQRHQENLDHAATINNKDQEIQRLHSLIQKEQQNNHALMTEHEKLQNQSQQLRFESQQRKDKVTDVLDQNSQLKKQIDSLSEEMRKLNLALHKTKVNNGVLESTNQIFENRLADDQKMIASLIAKLEKQDEKMERMNQKSFDLHENNSQLKAQITLLTSESVS